jgi:hypothetical protein
MKSFFIPIYLKLGKLIEEKLLVALICVTPEEIFFKYSNKRIQLCVHVVSHNYSQLAKEVLDQIQSKVIEVNTVLGLDSNVLFEKSHVFTLEYFEYLKKYSQNTLLFGSSESINFQNTTLSFEQLYEILMNEKIITEIQQKHNFHTKIKKQLKASSIDSKADIEFKISSNQLSGIYNDTTVSLISKNGGFIVADAIDFTNSIPSLTNSLNAFEVLINSLSKYSVEHCFDIGTYHILYSNPLAGSAQEKVFNSIYKNKKDLYKLVEEQSLSEITNKIINEPFQKVSTTIFAS